MKKSKFTESQIVFALHQAETGTRVGEVCRKMGISEATFYNWKKKFAGLGTSELRRLRQLEEENARLNKLVADLDPDCWIPPLFSGFTALMRAKILAETGPLRRFPHWRALLAYAGLKIRMRASGKYRGKDKITKKGRVLLRKHLGQAAFALARKDRLLGRYYHRKISEGMPARKAKVACMRKLLKILYGAAKSNQPFNTERVYRCAG